jgi:hypothetical protein
VPVPIAVAPPQERRRQDIMPFAKNIGPDVDAFASYSFNWMTTAIDGREDIFDEKTRASRISGRPL